MRLGAKGRLAGVCRGAAVLVLPLLLLSCVPGNSPRPGLDGSENVFYTPFTGRSPKTLDPASSYSSDESTFVYAVYEAPYGYHYLKRPYEIVPRAAEAVIPPAYFDKDGNPLPADAAPSLIAESRYTVPIKKGVLFAPHPCFARRPDGSLVYESLSREKASRLSSPFELPERGTRELTAEDYVYAVKRFASPRVVSPAFSTLGPRIIGLEKLRDVLREEDRRQGHPAFLDLRMVPFPEDGVTASDSHTLVIRVKGKYPQFRDWLTMSFFSAIPWEAELFYSNPGFSENSIGLAWWPVGTGPFMMAESRENRLHILARNPNYRLDPYPCEGSGTDREDGLLEACGRPMPFVDRIVFSIEKEALPLRAKFLQGYYDSPAIDRSDVGQGYLAEAADSPEKAKEYADKRIQFPRSANLSCYYLGFNMLDPVVGDGNTPEESRRRRALRQAISIALDWEEEISIFQKDQAVPLMAPLPPGLDPGPSFNSVVYRRTPDGKAERRPIADAMKLMEEAGYPSGRDKATGRPLVLSLDYQSSASGSKSLLDWYRKQFAKLGIELEIRATDYNRFQDKMNRGAAQIYLWGWLADYPDPENFLALLYGPNSKAVTGGQGENASNYRSSGFDALFEKMRFMDDGPEKDAAVLAMVEIAQRDAPMSFGYTSKSAAAYHEWVKNAKPSDMVRNSLQYLALDTDLRRRRIAEWNRPVLWPLAAVAAIPAALIFLVARLARSRGSRTAFRKKGEEKC